MESIFTQINELKENMDVFLSQVVEQLGSPDDNDISLNVEVPVKTFSGDDVIKEIRMVITKEDDSEVYQMKYNGERNYSMEDFPVETMLRVAISVAEKFGLPTEMGETVDENDVEEIV